MRDMPVLLYKPPIHALIPNEGMAAFYNAGELQNETEQRFASRTQRGLAESRFVTE